MQPLKLSVQILAIVSLCVVSGIAKSEVLLCPIATATATLDGAEGNRIVCGSETDLKRVEARANKLQIQRDVAIRAADQNLASWKQSNAKLQEARTQLSEAQHLHRAVTAVALTPTIQETASDPLPYLLTGIAGVALGVLGVVLVQHL